jgi:tRNA A-37 threonylcarbamoyl transferase component Bud32
LGWLLRSASYSEARSITTDGVRKHRLFYAPFLIWLGDPLVRILDAGIRVLPQRDWEERERKIYRSVYDASIRIDADGTMVLPYLKGRTLAALLDDPAIDQPTRKTAIKRATSALAEFHRLGFTHADAMAENVMIDDRGARWFDFETVHDSSRSLTWRRADDVRALLTTCLLRTAAANRAATIQCILDVYADEDITRALSASFTSIWRRSLTFHLAQAPLSYQSFQETVRLLRERAVATRHVGP